MASGTAAPARKRSIIYIDGFNFYYGAVKDTPHKWLDFEKLMRRVRPDDDIQQIRYFTALVNGTSQIRQKTYLSALATLPLVDVTLGRFKQKAIPCTVPPCTHSGDRTIIRQEEKRTDVSIGIAILDDAYQNLCDNIVLVSGDSDLVPALRAVKLRFPAKKLIVYVPARNQVRGAATELRAAADQDRTFPMNLIPLSLFAASIPDGAGGTITKPATW
ncbi:MAG: NYN domain-containing protein [Planctomycetia bacterium]|nr:NYN domain-containing protein [Planctomycetia bacterium]